MEPSKTLLFAFQRENQNHGDAELEETSRSHPVPWLKFSLTEDSLLIEDVQRITDCIPEKWENVHLFTAGTEHLVL